MQEKTCEPWLLHEFQDDFYGEELRLVVRLPACAALRTPARTRSIDLESGGESGEYLHSECMQFLRSAAKLHCIAATIQSWSVCRQWWQFQAAHGRCNEEAHSLSPFMSIQSPFSVQHLVIS